MLIKIILIIIYELSVINNQPFLTKKSTGNIKSLDKFYEELKKIKFNSDECKTNGAKSQNNQETYISGTICQSSYSDKNKKAHSYSSDSKQYITSKDQKYDALNQGSAIQQKITDNIIQEKESLPKASTSIYEENNGNSKSEDIKKYIYASTENNSRQTLFNLLTFIKCMFDNQNCKIDQQNTQINAYDKNKSTSNVKAEEQNSYITEPETINNYKPIKKQEEQNSYINNLNTKNQLIDFNCSTNKFRTRGHEEIFNEILRLRKERNLDNTGIFYSCKMQIIGDIHAVLLKESEANPNFKTCNLHSWPRSETKSEFIPSEMHWESCCINKASTIEDHKCYQKKGRELKVFNGNVYEISYKGPIKNSANNILNSFINSQGHRQVIFNEGMWTKPWKAVGVGIYENYKVVWFSNEEN